MAQRIPSTRVTAKPNPYTRPPRQAQPRSRAIVRDHRARRPRTGVVRRSIFTGALSFEDRLAELLFRLTQKFDKKISGQMQRIKTLEETGKIGGKRFSEKGLAGASGESLQKLSGALDREMFTLKRLTEKRKQLFNTISKTIEVFDGTARNAINSIRAT